jgi:cytochrome c-type biogenesis protein
MVGEFANLWLSFLAGLFAPLGAVCVLPLYPGFLAYLSGKISDKESRSKIIVLGVVVSFGVLSSMFLFGLIFTYFLQESLTRAIGIVSPIAFGILALVSLLMIFNFDVGRFIPHMNTPMAKNPILGAFVFGFFFGAIVLPCNPASLVILFAISTTTLSFAVNMLNFIFFGIGMALPLLIFSIASAKWNQKVIGFLTRNKRPINLTAGVIMLGISIYYLFFVFRILG